MSRFVPMLIALSLMASSCAFDVGIAPSQQRLSEDTSFEPLDGQDAPGDGIGPLRDSDADQGDADGDQGDADGDQGDADGDQGELDGHDRVDSQDRPGVTRTPSLIHSGLSESSFSGALQGQGYTLVPLGTGARFSGTMNADDGHFTLKALP